MDWVLVGGVVLLGGVDKSADFFAGGLAGAAAFFGAGACLLDLGVAAAGAIWPAGALDWKLIALASPSIITIKIAKRAVDDMSLRAKQVWKQRRNGVGRKCMMMIGAVNVPVS